LVQINDEWSSSYADQEIYQSIGAITGTQNFNHGGLELSAIIIFALNEIAAVSLLCFAWFKPVWMFCSAGNVVLTL